MALGVSRRVWLGFALVLMVTAAGIALPRIYRTALLGAASHFAITVAMAWAYYLAARRLPALVRRPVLYGALYGIMLWFVMIHVVVPLSAAPPDQSAPWAWVLWVNIAAHMFLVGVPCALGARWALRDG